MRSIAEMGKFRVDLPQEIHAVLTEEYMDVLDILREVNSAIRKRHSQSQFTDLLAEAVTVIFIDDAVVTDEPKPDELKNDVNYDMLLETLESMARGSEIDRSVRSGEPVFRRKQAA